MKEIVAKVPALITTIKWQGFSLAPALGSNFQIPIAIGIKLPNF
jgi:hypothetical protein